MVLPTPGSPFLCTDLRRGPDGAGGVDAAGAPQGARAGNWVTGRFDAGAHRGIRSAERRAPDQPSQPGDERRGL